MVIIVEGDIEKILIILIMAGKHIEFRFVVGQGGLKKMFFSSPSFRKHAIKTSDAAIVIVSGRFDRGVKSEI